MTWNCDKGFLAKNKLDDIKLVVSKHKPEVIGVSEVNFKRDDDNIDEDKLNYLTTDQLKRKLYIPDYNVILPESWNQHGVARVVVFVKEDLQCKIKHPSQPTSHLQSITLKLGYGRSKTHFFNFYYREWTNWVRGDRTHQEEDLDSLLDIWRECTENQSDFVAMGDMNICAKKMSDPNYVHAGLASKLSDFLLEENCSQLIDDYTRIRKVGQEIQRSALDHVTINCPGKVSKPKIFGVGNSDHMGTMMTKTSREIRANPRSVKKRIYKNFDEESFRQDILHAKDAGLFKPVLDCNDEDIANEIFVRVYTSILDRHAPLKVIHNRNNYVPYLNSELKSLMSERELLKEISIATGTVEDYEKYKEKRNEVSTKLKNVESNHNKSKFSNEKIEPADVWKSTRQILGAPRSNFPTQILAEGKLISKPLEMAKAVNKFFIEKILKLKENSGDNHINATRGLQSYLEKKDLPETEFALRELGDEDVIKLVKKLKGKKSCGVDWICGYSLKKVAKDLIPELKTLINLSIRNQRFPKQWKFSKILPAFKNKGTKFDLKFYRPLSNLPEVSKLAERAVYDQMYKYLADNSLIHPNHHGYLQNCSTSTAIQQMYDIWLKSIDNGKMAAVLFLDLSAGFDVVNHDILIRKLRMYNFSDGAIQWFQSYLTERLQAVQIESAFSPPLSVPYGVPQGSILGPLLFLLYINELPDVVKDSDETEEEETQDEVVVYADDSTASTADANPEVLAEKIQKHAKLLPDWFTENDLIVSSEKTKMLVVTTTANRATNITTPGYNFKIKVGEEEIEEAESEKVLGVIVNNKATWQHHLHGNEDYPGLLKQLSQRVGMLKQVRKYMNKRQYKIIMNGIFTSKLLYCITTWGGIWGLEDMDETTRNHTATTKEDMRKLQVLQNKAVRLHMSMPRDTPTSTLLTQSRELSVHQLVAYHSALQVYKVYTTRQPTYHFNRFFGSNPQDLNTRSIANQESRIEFKLSLSRSSFFYQSSRVWSAIPGTIKTARNLETFKRAMKQWIKNNISVKP